MSRRHWLAAGALAVLLVACGVAVPLVGLPFFGPGDGGAVPTVTVEPRDFEHRVLAEGYLEAAESTAIAFPPGLRQTMRIAWMAEDGSRVEAGDPVMRFDPTDFEKEMEDALADSATTEIRVGKEMSTRESQLARLDRDAEMARLELDNARQFQKEDEGIFSRHDIIESEIDEELAQDRLEHAEGSRRTRESLSDAELELLAIERRKAEMALEQAREGLSALELTAPHEGLVIFRRDWRGELPRVGENVWPGNALAEIPDLGTMQAEVYVLEADAGGLAEGRPATVILEAHPDRVYDATVKSVDKLAKPRLRGSPVQYFAVVLELEETVPEIMKPGQRVRAWLHLEEIGDALAVPRQAVFEDDGSPVVYVRRDGGFEAVPVELGPAALGRVVVTRGLAAGDRVALVDPTRPRDDMDLAGDGDEGGEGGAGGALGGVGR